MLAGAGGGDGLRGVQIIRRGDVDDVDVVGLEQILEARRHAGAADRLSVLRERGVHAIGVAADHATTSVCGFFWNAAMCCAAHQPRPAIATPSFPSDVGTGQTMMKMVSSRQSPVASPSPEPRV